MSISYKILMLLSALLLTICLCVYQPLLGLFTQDHDINECDNKVSLL